MISKKTQNIIIKFLNNQATSSELEELEEWLENDANEKEFINYVKINYLVDMNIKKFNTLKSERKLLDLIAKEKKVYKLKNSKIFFKYAAAIAILISTVYFYNQSNVSLIEQNSVSSEKITLKMDDGNIKVIDEKGNFKIQDFKGNVIGTQQGNELVYDDKKVLEKLVYNTLTVPYGKRFSVKLSDGTKVHLNAGTSLRYPIKFLKGKERLVFVETGEAYFDVTKDVEHPFIVNNGDVNIRVLGTEFNVSSYPEDATIKTVLVEGSVSLYATNEKYDVKNSTVLKPGFKADWNKSNDVVKVDKADVEMYTAWIDGKIILKHMKFSSIIKKIERHYNVSIQNEDKVLGDEFITATFEDESIEQVLEVINKLHPIEYSVKDNKIVILKKE
ncbi:FecR domain-containing protein [Polaribacter litorisediminis]|uniref:FecR family protein n=1 Tax=Polaribacter litorisediminis TaxID=1908341 RepID=UPI001CBDD405|nr:FecR domain-containing protein [Polaribacter litorisediminis]UAM97990.1 FecR domain-containing protein [Polaribacter litorisediminis]